MKATPALYTIMSAVCESTVIMFLPFLPMLIHHEVAPWFLNSVGPKTKVTSIGTTLE